MAAFRRVLATMALLFAVAASAFYIPGINPRPYFQNDIVQIHANGLHSVTNIVPYDFYEAPFCRPKVLLPRHETIGEMLSGENIRASPYYANMAVDAQCTRLLCSEADRIITPSKARKLGELIEKGYRAHMVIDNLPAFNNGTLPYQGRCVNDKSTYNYLRGWMLGVPKSCMGDTLINNHLHFTIQFHRVEAANAPAIGTGFEGDVQDALIDGQVISKKKKKPAGKKAKEDVKPDEDADQFLVVGVTVEPFSVKWPADTAPGETPGCNDEFDPRSGSVQPLRVKDLEEAGGKITWTYGVTWVEEPNIRWASRWDSYLHTSPADSNDRIHWLSIINTLLIVMCLSSMVFLVILRALKRDLARYNAVFELSKEEQAEAHQEEGGWKVVHGDVFRAPRRLRTFTILVSSGVQTAAMVASLLFFATLGFSSPANRGGLMTALLLLFVLQSFVAGYFGARMLLKLGGEKSWSIIFEIAMFLPAIVFSVFLACNSVLRAVHSSGAVPLPMLLTLLALWLLVALPLTMVGGAFGFRVVPGPHARKVNAIPRPIDPATQPQHLSTPVVVALAGIVPFAALFLELKYILASLWQGMVYYVFGFLAAVFCLWVITVALTAIVIVYARLCAENYHWWWVSFAAPSSLGVHLYAFLAYYFFAQLTIQSGAATVIYFLYMALVTFFYVLCSGAIGFLASWLFVHVIYSSVKID